MRHELADSVVESLRHLEVEGIMLLPAGREGGKGAGGGLNWRRRGPVKGRLLQSTTSVTTHSKSPFIGGSPGRTERKKKRGKRGRTHLLLTLVL